MIQSFLIANIDRREYLAPAKFGDGTGLLEFGASASGTMTGLAILLASGCAERPRELPSKDPIIGSWARCRIVIAGNFDPELFTELGPSDLHELLQTHGVMAPSAFEAARHLYKDISDAVIRVLATDPYERRALIHRGVLVGGKQPP